jgi:FKBP-type peptidyl-prolyl cis-trans isomerase
MKPIRILAATLCALLVFSSVSVFAVAQSAPARKTARKALPPKKQDDTASQLRELKEMMERQQADMQQVQQQLQDAQRQLQETQSALKQTQQPAQHADAKAATVESDADVQVKKMVADLSEAKDALSTTTAKVAKQEAKVSNLEHPTALSYKGIRITPGGWLELTGYFRSNATLSDQGTPFQSIPLESQVTGGFNSQLTEFGFTMRDSRILLRVDAGTDKTSLTGLYEMDFFGTGPTSNPNQTTGYVPRIRQAWSRARFSNGWAITGGQMWNLITLNRKGTDADTAWVPNVIEAQYSIGYDWGRFGEIRVSKSFHEKAAIALGLANPSYLNSGTSSAVAGLASNGAGADANSLLSSCTQSTATPPVVTCTNTPLYSTNMAPDVIVKMSYDSAKLGHLELKTLGRIFRDRVVATTTAPGWNNTGFGGGIAAGLISPVIPKKVDLIFQGMYGKGISRYQDAGQYDFVVRGTDHNMQAIKSFSVLAGFETHPSKKVELNLFFGNEYYARSTYLNGSTIAGYGAPTAVNTGCYYETVPANINATCTGNNRDLWNGKAFGYYDVYKGPLGTLRYGVEFDYIERGTWSGAGGLAPHGSDSAAFSTMRYILP